MSQKARISRRKSGIPAMIPATHRKAIRMGSRGYISFWLTLFSLYRVLSFEPKFKLDSIIRPSNMSNKMVSNLVSYMPIFLIELLKLTKNKWLNLCLTDQPSALKELRIKPIFSSKSSSVSQGYASGSLTSILTSIITWKFDPTLPY